jgi:hypothetical protein
MSVSIGKSRFHLPDYAMNRIDPTLWKQETERMAGLLKNSEHLVSMPNSTSWRFHLEMMAKYCLTHLQYLKNDLQKGHLLKQEVLGPMEKPLGKQISQTPVPNGGSSPLIDSLIQLKNVIQSEIQTIAQKERYLNNQANIGKFSLEYASSKKVRKFYGSAS